MVHQETQIGPNLNIWIRVHCLEENGGDDSILEVKAEDVWGTN